MRRGSQCAADCNPFPLLLLGFRVGLLGALQWTQALDTLMLRIRIAPRSRRRINGQWVGGGSSFGRPILQLGEKRRGTRLIGNRPPLRSRTVAQLSNDTNELVDTCLVEHLLRSRWRDVDERWLVQQAWIHRPLIGQMLDHHGNELQLSG